MRGENIENDIFDSDDSDEEGDSLDEYEAPKPGIKQEKATKVPRHDLEKLRPYERMYADNYTYQNSVYGGAKWSFVLVDVKTNAIHHYDVKSKKENGKQFARIVAKEGIHKLPYKCTISTDNCGSMQHVIAAAIRLGIN